MTAPALAPLILCQPEAGASVAAQSTASLPHAPPRIASSLASRSGYLRPAGASAARLDARSASVTSETPSFREQRSENLESYQPYESARPAIDRLLDHLLRRTGLPDADAEDFRSRAHAHLVERDCHVLRQHKGPGSIESYLAVVLNHLLSDFRNSLWGKWRPSACARRNGWVAIRLEEMLYRDKFSAREAVMTLMTQHRELQERELWSLVRTLPRRVGVRIVPVEQAEGPEMARIEPGDDMLEREEAERALLAECVQEAVKELDVEDRLLAIMHYVDDRSLATISRALSLPQRPLYRRRDAMLERLQRSLEARGVSGDRVRELLDRDRTR